MTSLAQRSFGGGIVSPQVYGKQDMVKFSTGLKECLNWWITKYTTAENRPGTTYTGLIENDPDNEAVLIPFVFSDEISYVLVIYRRADDYIAIRFINQDAFVPPTGAFNWSSLTNYVQGDIVTYSGRQYWCMIPNINVPPEAGLTNAYWFIMTAGYFEVPFGILIEINDLSMIRYQQKNSVMTFTSQEFKPRQLIRFSDTDWTMNDIDVSDTIYRPTNIAVSAGAGGSTVYRYTVTAIDSTTGVESTRGYSATARNVQTLEYGLQIEDGDPAILHCVAHDMLTGDSVILAGAGFPAVIGTGPYQIIVIDADHFSLNGTSFDGSIAHINPGTATPNEQSVTSATPVPGTPNVITWTAVDGASKYNIYSLNNGIFGYIGTSQDDTFNDVGITPAIGIQPPVLIPLFQTANDYPAVVGTYQERLMFANTANQTQTVWASNTGAPNRFLISTPVKDSDAIQFTIDGQQVQTVQALVDLGELIIHTSAGEYRCRGNSAGTLTPTGISLGKQGHAGCSTTVPPVGIGNTDLFVQARENIIRDLQFSIQTNSYIGKDCTIFSSNLFANKTITAMAWQQIPHSILWVGLSDGTLLGFTYIKEHEIWGWHRHETINGDIKRICIIPEGTEDALYLYITRTILDEEVHYVERLANREFSDITTDAIFTDSSLTYDGRNTGGTTITATTGTGWLPSDSITLTASASQFSLTDIGDEYRFYQRDEDDVITDSVSFQVIAYTSATVVTALPLKTVPTWARSAATTSWAKAVHTFSGLTHLAGETITGLGDGWVIPETVVSNTGTFTTQNNYIVVTVGLPITADLETLDIENMDGETLMNKKKAVVEMTAMFYSSRGGLYGQDADHLLPFKQRTDEPWNVPDYLMTGPYRIPLQAGWQKTGQVFLRQNQPLPLGLSAVVVTAQVGN